MTTSTPPVVFDPTAFAEMFPEFAPLTTAQLNGYFMRAELIFANSVSNPAYGDGNMPGLFNLLTAHIAYLNCPKDANGNPAATGTAASQLVGRISSANQGSVSVSVEYQGDGAPNAAYFSQTKYGAEFWAATAQYRTARYLARPTIVINGLLPGLWNRGGFIRR